MIIFIKDFDKILAKHLSFGNTKAEPKFGFTNICEVPKKNFCMQKL